LDRINFLGVQAKTDPLYFIHDEVGYNYRMTNIQAAFGTDQIDRLEGFIKTKIMNYNLYKQEVEKIEGLHLIPFKKDTRANHWFYSIIVNKDKYGMNRDELLLKLNHEGIQTRPLWGLIHKQKPYLNNQGYKLVNAEFYEENLINIPCSSNLNTEDVDYIVNRLKMNK
jgi:dTDP-4-amino-4,6-dideoxygalactose transaminase